MQIVRIALDVPLSTVFDYGLPEGMMAVPGQRVIVPFGRKQMLGVVMAISDATEVAADRIKPVVEVLDDVPPLSEELLALLRFCSEYYHCPIGQTVLSALPTRFRSLERIAFRQDAQYELSEAGRAMELAQLPKRKVVQRRLLEALQQGSMSASQIRMMSPSAPAALKALLAAGWVVRCAQEEAATSQAILEQPHALTVAQQQAVDAVTQAQGFSSFLLHGVTGSGKTEVYVHLMHHVLAQGNQVLLLVPEINLTPQLEQYFRNRFPATELVGLHSGLNDGERAKNWLRAQSGHARIIIGTRLAVFAPLPRLALVIVDEEHDTSFKQQDGLRYSARDVAIFRASQRDVPVVLGSATPSLESWHNAQNGRYRLLQMRERASAQSSLPAVRFIDTTREKMPDGISEHLYAALAQRMERGEQSLVFINRRGYSPVLMCGACGWLSGCPHCAGKLVLHLRERRLRCHHCGHQMRVPPACPDCGNADLQPVGVGTQRAESALQERFPAARILRVDRDSTRNKGAWQAMQKQIKEDAVDILVGTQILAKGHDFPNLTMVGVLNADGALYSGDFRASEKLYAQLAQVAGRAGRAGKAGEVLIQTAFPDHPLFQALRAHDYDAWANLLLDERRMAGFPPFMYQVLLAAEGQEENPVYEFLRRAREAALQCQLEVEIYGVVPSSLARRAGYHRAQLLIQSTTRKSLQRFVSHWRPALEALPAPKLRWSLDIDPLEF